MGQNQVKIPAENHVLIFRLHQNSQISITAQARDQNGLSKTQYYQEYLFGKFPEAFRNQFQNPKRFFKILQDNSGICCTTRQTPYRFAFNDGKLLIRKSSKTLYVDVQKVEKSNISAQTIQFNQRISLQDRLQKQLTSNRNSMAFQYKSAQNIQLPQSYNLQGCLVNTQNGLMLNLFQKNIKQTHLRQLSVFDTPAISEVDIIGNNLSTQNFKIFLGLDWKYIKKLWADNNLIQKLEGLQKLDHLIFLSLSQNLLSIKAAQQLSKMNLPKLQFLKVSFLPTKTTKCWQKMIQNNFKNFPSLNKLVVVNNIFLEDRVIKKLQKWKNQQPGRQVIYSINQHMKNIPTSTPKHENQNSTKINSLSNYPQI